MKPNRPTRYKELIEIDGQEMKLTEGIDLALNILCLAWERILELEKENLELSHK